MLISSFKNIFKRSLTMKKAKIISAILSFALVATHSTLIIPSISSKTRYRHLTAYAYSENVSGNWIQDKDTGKWWFKHDDGSYTKNSWEKIEDIWYHFDMYGWMQTGWLKDGDKWYYLDPNGAMHMGWKQINTTWYYFTSNGTMYNTGWLKDNGKYYYLNPSGAMHTGWKEIDGKWYYFNSNGIMLKDWLTLNNKKYYLGTDGVMYVGLKQVEGKYYYFNENGTMRTGTGWFTDTNGKKYYFNSDGTAHTGWLSLDNKKYNFDKNGIMQTGWLEENGKKYFLYNTGEAAIGCSPTSYDHTDSGFNYTEWHNFDSNGAMIESDGNGEPMVLLFDWYIQDSAELSAKHIQPLKKGDFVYCTDTVKKEYYGNTGVYAKINYENRISGYVLMYDDLAVSNSDCTICTGRPGIVLEEADKKFKKYFS